MPELFDDGPADTEFELPGDSAWLDRARANLNEEPPAAAPAAAPAEAPAEPEAVEEPAAAPAEPATPAGDADAAAAAAAQQELAAAAGVDLSDPQVQEYLAKFDGDLGKALRAGAEAQTLIGRQGNELGELRRTIQEGFQGLEERQAAPAAHPQWDPDALETWFAENPTRIKEVAQAAFYSNDEALLNVAMSAWAGFDEAGAKQFDRQMIAQSVRSDLAAEAEEQQQAAAAWNETAREFGEQHPDLDQLAPKMRELAPNYPMLVNVLRTGDPQSKREVLEFLYDKARQQVSGDVTVTARTIAREQAQAAEEAITAAAVASATTVAPATPPPLADRISAEWDKLDAPFAAGEDGWNV